MQGCLHSVLSDRKGSRMRPLLFAALLLTTSAASARGVAYNGNVQIVAQSNQARHAPATAKGNGGHAGLNKFNPYSGGGGQPAKRK